MTAWSDIMKTILDAGAWTTYGETPPIITLYEDSLRTRKNHIYLIDEDENPVLDHASNELMATKTGSMTIFARNKDGRDKMWADFKTIVPASGYSITYSGSPSAPQRNVFRYDIGVELLD